MPTYEVRRRTVLSSSVVTAANETEARFLARDIWQTDAAIAALAADVTRQPFGPDDADDARSEQRYEETASDRESEEAMMRRWAPRLPLGDAEATEWP